MAKKEREQKPKRAPPKTQKQAIREAGKLRVAGKTYVMQDSDVCHFLFTV